MHKTESEALASPQPSGWQQLLANIEQLLRTLTEGASTPLALNMKMLALLADMEHAYQLLGALLVVKEIGVHRSVDLRRTVCVSYYKGTNFR